MRTGKLIGILILGTWMAAIRSDCGTGANPEQAGTCNPGKAQASSKEEKVAGVRSGFVGDEACQECHRDISETYSRTAHHLTSRAASKESIAGSFAEGANILRTSDQDLHFLMEAKNNGFYETAVFWQPPNEKTRSERIDIVTGSGEKGQTYLHWRGDQLFQLPVSYWAELGWINSPGFKDGIADFNRPIVPRCLECHATYFEGLGRGKAENYYKKTGFVLGVSCERCHGPGRGHVESQRRKVTATAAALDTPIVNPSALTRDRQMEVCAQCHGGIGQSLAPTFSYIPGKQLEDYIALQVPDPDARVDVHGNQVALTQRSRCYQSSQMTCSTCHDVHGAERAPATYSEKCLQCHKDEECGEFPKLGAKLRENCVDCHMPVQDSDLIVAELQGKRIKARMRNHWIKVYSAEQNPNQ